MARHRRSVALSGDAKVHLDHISEARGVSANRAIELAVEKYYRRLAVEEREGGELIAFVVQPNDGGPQHHVYLL